MQGGGEHTQMEDVSMRLKVQVAILVKELLSSSFVEPQQQSLELHCKIIGKRCLHTDVRAKTGCR